MSYTLYHGCIKSAVEPITHGEYGDYNDIVHPWTCSYGDSIFFHDKELMKMAECGYDDESQDEFAYQYCLEHCNEQAQIQNACLPHPFDVTCVLEVTFHGDEFETWEDICIPDDSCPNMPTAVCMWADTFNKMVEDGKVSFKVHEFEFFPKLALIYLQPLMNNSLFNKEVLNNNELRACETLNANGGIYIEELNMPEEVQCYTINNTNFKEDK